ncbi:MAG: hypothetical protein SPI30_03250 [Prevotella sp.]|nr:hypothetical protein [Prevotella sp.]
MKEKEDGTKFHPLSLFHTYKNQQTVVSQIVHHTAKATFSTHELLTD